MGWQDDFYKVREISNGKWRRILDHNAEAFCTIVTDKYVAGVGVGDNGTRNLIYDRKKKCLIKKLTGFRYVYTGDISPDETELFALENGRHFYIISLPECEIKKKVELPRTYESSDVYGTYSDDGKRLFVPINRYDKDRYRYFVCEYETGNYTFVKMDEKETSDDIGSWSNADK